MADSLRSVSAIERAFLTVYCVLTWLVYAVCSLRSGALFAKATKEEDQELRAARARFWDLSKQWEGLSHRFLELSDGFRMHYVTNAAATSDIATTDKPIVIFFHGFPDSWAVWRHIISRPSLQQKCIIVAPDLPGYGGSDSLTGYGPNDLLGHIASFVVDVRKRYDKASGNRRRAIIVAHDWGASIAFRLASEAPQLADRFIIANGPLNYNSLGNFQAEQTKALSCLKRLKFRETKEAAKPVVRQLLMSHYVVLFQSPFWLLKIFATIGNYAFIRFCHRHVSGRPTTITGLELQEYMAATLGPSEEQQKTLTEGGDKYPTSVTRRGAEFVLKHPMSYYREGTFTQTWEKSQGLKESLDRLGPDDESAEKTVRAKTTVVWGTNDPALSAALCLKNLDKYLVADSQVVELPRSGHGIPVELESRVALTKAIDWAIEGEENDLGKSITSVYPDAHITARR